MIYLAWLRKFHLRMCDIQMSTRGLIIWQCMDIETSQMSSVDIPYIKTCCETQPVKCALRGLHASTGLIKSNRPHFQLHFSMTYVLGNIWIFGKTLHKMLNFQYTLKLITCHTSFRSSDTKQWQTLWSRKLSFTCVTVNFSTTYHGLCNPGLNCDEQAQSNMTRSLIWKSLTSLSMSRVLLNWEFPFQPWKIFGTDIKNMGVWSIVLFRDFLKVILTATLGSHSHGNMKQHNLRVDCANTACGFCVSPLAQEWHDADNDVVVTGLIVQCGHSPQRAALPGV